jgi:hypothetical protein
MSSTILFFSFFLKKKETKIQGWKTAAAQATRHRSQPGLTRGFGIISGFKSGTGFCFSKIICNGGSALRATSLFISNSKYNFVLFFFLEKKNSRFTRGFGIRSGFKSGIGFCFVKFVCNGGSALKATLLFIQQ